MAAHFQTARGRFVVVNGYFPKGSGPARDNSRVSALVHNSRSRSIIALHPEIRGPA